MGPTEKKATELLKERFGEAAVMEVKEFRDEVTVVVRGGFIAEMARILRDEPELEYNFLSDLCGVDWPGRPERFEVVYNLYSMRHKSRLRLKVRLPESDPTVPTVSDVWPTANWHERETYDLFGIRFVGHPDLRRILNPDDFEVFPYRKDFPIR